MQGKRQFIIPVETLKEADKCSKYHACLTQNEYQLCGITISTEHRARMVCGYEADCAYSSRIGNQFVCTCPVRHSIYRKYGA